VATWINFIVLQKRLNGGHHVWLYIHRY
jgi:fascin 1